MITYNTITEMNTPTAVALGHFDGIHKGHQLVIGSAVKGKIQNNLTPVVFTFQQNPASIVKNKKIPYLMTRHDKNKHIEQLGVEVLYDIDFHDVRGILPEEFVREILYKKLKAGRVYCGFNYHFGNGGTANSENLRDLCSKYNIEVVALPPAMYHDEPVSSTRIRHYLKQGRVSDVTRMLGREYSYELTVCKGNQLGRRMGTPTFNQIIPEELILPRFGVYVTAVTNSEGKKICGVTNIGIKPTIGTESPLAETWLPNYNCGELYGKTVKFELLEFMRGEKKFSSIFELKASILSDGQKAQKIFHHYFKENKMSDSDT